MLRTMVTICGLALTLCVGCGGSQKSSNTAADVQVEASPIEELQGMSTELKANLEAVVQPITDVDRLIDDVTSLPQRLSIDASSLRAVVAAKITGSEVSLTADIAGREDVKAEIDALLSRVDGIMSGLKSTPERVKVLSACAAKTVARLPVLATKVTSSAQATIANPFAKADAKAAAQAELDKLASVQADVQAMVQTVQQKVMELPGLATGALAKLTASFAS